MKYENRCGLKNKDELIEIIIDVIDNKEKSRLYMQMVKKESRFMGDIESYSIVDIYGETYGK